MEKKEEKMVDFDLSFTYDGGEALILKEVKGTVPKGKCIVLCGASGCGKSTLLRCFNRLIPDFYEGQLRGYCRLNGQDMQQMSIGQAGTLAASVFQDPRSQFFTLNSSTELAFGLENFGVPHEKIVSRVEEAFRRFGLERLKNREVFALSSGERQLVAILAAWAIDTELFLLDEPTANLDSAAVEQLKGLFGELKTQGKTLLISEHRLYYLRELADEYWLMERGQIVRKYTKEEFLTLSPRELGALRLRTTDLRILENQEKMPAKAECHHRLRLENIRFSYSRKGNAALRGIDLEAQTGEIIGLVGHNGCGKTTLGKLTAGLLKGGTGRFLLDGTPMSRKKRIQNSIFIMQEAEFQFFTDSVTKELCYGRSLKEEDRERIRTMLKSCDLWHCRNQHPFSLSGGQMQKLVLMLACLSEKPVVILDEPTAGLDRESLDCCVRLIEEMARNKIVLIISHDLELMAGVCTRCVSLRQGRICGAYDLMQDTGFEGLKAFLNTGLIPPEISAEDPVSCPLLDPRTKILLFLLAMTVGVWTDLALMACCFGAVLAAALYERRLNILILSGCWVGAIAGFYLLFPGVLGSFLLNFFPRILLVWAAAALLVQKEEASRTLAALRKLHVPEQAILVVSVVFRFFPVLRKDLGLMMQSVKTRGFSPKGADRGKAVSGYAEILVVPLVFRVIRIAEVLSASAETRGIALKTRRDSYISVKLRPADYSMFTLTAALLAAGMIR